MNYLIFGVDPGTTTAVAALDLDGNLVSLKSERHFGLNGVIDHIMSVGTPLLIASDVNPCPEFILKLAASLGASVHFPEKSMNVGEKKKLTCGLGFEGAHQRDALASALNAFASYENKFRKIDARKLGVDAKKRVLAGEKITPAKKYVKAVKKPKLKSPAKSDGLGKKLRNLQAALEAKEREVRRLEKQISELEAKSRAAYSERAIERSTILSIRTLKSKLRARDAEVREYRQLAQALEKAGEGIFRLVGVYPKTYGGLTLLRQKIRGEDLDSLSKAKFVFTDAESDKSVLNKLGAFVLSPSLLTEVSGFHFVKTTDLVAPEVEEQVSLSNLVSDYRGSRH